MLNLGDIKSIDGGLVPPVDVITGGSPCQNLSVAGNRQGLNGSESSLFFEQVRVARQMRAATNGQYPKFMVWENVPGAFTSNKGNDFRSVLEGFIYAAAGKNYRLPMPSKWGGQDLSQMKWGRLASLGDCTTRNFGESPSDVKESPLSLIFRKTCRRNII